LPPVMHARVRLAADKFAVANLDATVPKPPSFRYVLAGTDSAGNTVTVTVKETGVTMERLALAPDAAVELMVNSEPRAVRFRKGSLADLKPGMPVNLELAVGATGVVVRRIQAAE
jgi:hypothetical protein